jgi:hypothetical protein
MELHAVEQGNGFTEQRRRVLVDLLAIRCRRGFEDAIDTAPDVGGDDLHPPRDVHGAFGGFLFRRPFEGGHGGAVGEQRDRRKRQDRQQQKSNDESRPQCHPAILPLTRRPEGAASAYPRKGLGAVLAVANQHASGSLEQIPVA